MKHRDVSLRKSYPAVQKQNEIVSFKLTETNTTAFSSASKLQHPSITCKLETEAVNKSEITYCIFIAPSKKMQKVANY